MKTSDKILLTALVVVIVGIVAALLSVNGVINAAITHGDGNITTQTRTLENFDKLKVRGRYTVNYSTDNQYRVTITADNNLQEFIRTEVRNSELIIESAQAMRTTDDMTIELWAPQLTHIETHASARFFSKTPLIVPEMILSANAGSEINIEGIFELLKVTQNAGANVTLRGKADELTIDTNAGGTVDATGLESGNTTVSANAGASASVNATKLNASANAGGSVYYLGTPIFEGISTTAGGNISKIN